MYLQRKQDVNKKVHNFPHTAVRMRRLHIIRLFELCVGVSTAASYILGNTTVTQFRVRNSISHHY